MTAFFRPTFGSIALLALLAFTPVIVSADDSIGDHVVIARSSANATLIWDATDDVAFIMKQKLSDSAANMKLEHDGLSAIASQLGSLEKSTTSITLRIVYTKLGEFNAAYKAATLAGIEQYATLAMGGKEAFGNRGKWRTLSPAATIPAWVHYKVVGLLPPR